MHAPHLSVVTPSSHDTSTLRGWWQELSAEERQKAWWLVGGGDGAVPPTMDTHLTERFVAQHLNSPAMWAVFPMQDLMALDTKTTRGGSPDDERINVPANPEHYWRYRMHLSFAELHKAHSWIQKLKDLLAQSRRAQSHR